MTVRLSTIGTLLFLLVGCGAVPGRADGTRSASGVVRTADDAAIRDVLASYNAALNDGRTGAVLPLYEPDGVFMAPYAPSSIGTDAVREAYDGVFAELRFDVRFDVVEVVRMAPDWAFVRTDSAGTTRHASTGKTTVEANQELFILKKDDSRWRIARYSFSPTNPPSR